MKVVPYFSHDHNARNSPELARVRMKFGAEGYGIYFMILERLREDKNYMSVTDYNAVAFDLRVDTSKVKSIVEDFGLFVFTDDGKYFYSESFNKRMEMKDEEIRKKSEAGKKGAEARWGKKDDDNNSVIENNSTAITELQKNIASKEKKSKENKSKEKNSNTITDSDILEYKKLYPASWVDEAVEICVSKNKGVNYLDGILKNFQREKSSFKKTKFHNFKMQSESLSDSELNETALKLTEKRSVRDEL